VEAAITGSAERPIIRHSAERKVFPAFLRGSIFLTVLAVLPFPLMIYWLIRVHFSKAYKVQPPTPVSVSP
jgi:hypothetical protein